MKRLLILLALAFSMIANAQVKESDIIECKNMTFEKIWNRTDKWQMTLNESFDCKLESKNKSIGVMVFKVRKPYRVNQVSDADIQCKLSIEVNEEMIKYTFYDAHYDFIIKELDDIEYMSKRMLEYYKKQYSALERLAGDGRSIPKDLDASISACTSLMEIYPKYKKPKDEKKGKVNPYWEDLNNTIEAANNIKKDYDYLMGDVLHSIKMNIVYK